MHIIVDDFLGKALLVMNQSGLLVKLLKAYDFVKKSDKPIKPVFCLKKL